MNMDFALENSPLRRMIVARSLSALRTTRRPVVLAVGFFDGVHLGHIRVIRTAVIEAAALRGEPWILTFDPHPMRLLRPHAAPPLLTCVEHKLAVMEQLGIKGAIVMRFTMATARIPAELFARRLVSFSPPLAAIVVGNNWRFGAGAAGTPAMLRRLFRKLGADISVRTVAPVRSGGAAVSSTRIRSAVTRGMLEAADAMLGRPFGFWGTVVRGDGRGGDLGYPTANIEPHGEAFPPPGVYAAFVAVGDRLYRAVMNIGRRPTFVLQGAGRPVIEAHLLGFRGRLYGRNVMIYPIRRLRSEKIFRTPAELVRRIEQDISDADSALRKREKAFQKKATWSLHQTARRI